MQIVEVTESNIAEAGYVHSEAWKASHRAFCAAAFVEQHTPAAQADYLRREMAAMDFYAGVLFVSFRSL